MHRTEFFFFFFLERDQVLSMIKAQKPTYCFLYGEGAALVTSSVQRQEWACVFIEFLAQGFGVTPDVSYHDS